MFLRKYPIFLYSCLNARKSSTIAGDLVINPVYQNRNPRNLERLRIARKHEGYHLEGVDKRFWHRLELKPSGEHVQARVVHFINGPVITASTKEWAVKKQLYRDHDTAAYINLARVLAHRCLQFGIIEMKSSIKSIPGRKVEKFLNYFQESGIKIVEPHTYTHPKPWDRNRPERPWTVFEEQVKEIK